MFNNDLYICPCCGGRYYDGDYVSPSPSVNDIDWESIDNTLVGYCDDKRIISYIRDNFQTIDKGDYISFVINDNNYRLYI